MFVDTILPTETMTVATMRDVLDEFDADDEVLVIAPFVDGSVFTGQVVMAYYAATPDSPKVLLVATGVLLSEKPEPTDG